jgi:hypothetical protein
MLVFTDVSVYWCHTLVPSSLRVEESKGKNTLIDQLLQWKALCSFRKPVPAKPMILHHIAAADLNP